MHSLVFWFVRALGDAKSKGESNTTADPKARNRALKKAPAGIRRGRAVRRSSSDAAQRGACATRSCQILRDRGDQGIDEVCHGSWSQRRRRRRDTK